MNIIFKIVAIFCIFILTNPYLRLYNTVTRSIYFYAGAKMQDFKLKIAKFLKSVFVSISNLLYLYILKLYLFYEQFIKFNTACTSLLINKSDM